MNILSFDTCLDKTYITLSSDKKIIRSKIICSKNENYHSAYLISSIIEILKSENMTPRDLDCIATDIGPGSFTGIRACTTVARVLAQQLNIKVIGVSSLEILSKILGDNDLVVIDARKNKGYVFDKEIKGAIDLEEIDKIVKNRTVITDYSLFQRLNKNAFQTISYQSGDFRLGDILSIIANNKQQINWYELKPLYIQPPPVFGK